MFNYDCRQNVFTCQTNWTKNEFIIDIEQNDLLRTRLNLPNFIKTRPLMSNGSHNGTNDTIKGKKEATSFIRMFFGDH